MGRSSSSSSSSSSSADEKKKRSKKSQVSKRSKQENDGNRSDVDESSSKRRRSDDDHRDNRSRNTRKSQDRSEHRNDHVRDNRHRGGNDYESRNRERNDRYKSNDRDNNRHDRGNRNHYRPNNSRDDDSKRHESNNRNRGDQFRNNRRDDNFRNNRRRSRSGSFDHKNASWGKADESKPEEKVKVQKETVNFGKSGKLTEETNTYRGVVIKYSEPPEARKPKRRWRLYPFKGEKALQTLYIHRESAYLVGRDRKVVDLPVDHPSCSKQHAVIQYRLVSYVRDDHSTGKRVRPYLIDLESANGTYINNNKIDAKKYVELMERDVIKFGFSSREYVLLHENSKDDALDDDVKQEEEDEKPVKSEPK